MLFLPLFEQGGFICDGERSLAAPLCDCVLVDTSVSDVNFLAGIVRRFINDHLRCASFRTSAFVRAMRVKSTENGNKHVEGIEWRAKLCIRQTQ